MIKGTYDVAIDTPKAHKRGVMVFDSADGIARAELTIKDYDPVIFSGTIEDKEFVFEGSCDLPTLGQVAYSCSGEAWGNSISAVFETDKGKVELFGTRLSGAAGGEKSSHEYMMAAATGEFDSDDNTMYSGLYADGG